MMRGALTIAALAVAYLPAALGSPTTACSVFASSKNVVETIIAEKNLSTSVTTEAQLASTVSYLYRKYTMGSTGFNTNLYYGDYQDNFYILKNCWASENRQPSDSNDFNVYCQQAGATQYLLFMRNLAVKGDTNLYIYPLNAAGIMGAPLITRNNTFLLSEQKWHRQTDSTWSEDFTYTDKAKGSYYTRTIFGVDNAFVATVAAEWTSSEVCRDYCLDNAAAKASVAAFERAYTAARAANELVQDNEADRVYRLYESMTASNNGYGAFLWYAEENGDYYALEDCYRLGAESASCISAGANVRYLAHVMPQGSQRTIYKYSPGANFLGTADSMLVSTTANPNPSKYSLTAEQTYSEATAEGKWHTEAPVGFAGLKKRPYSKQILVSGTLVARAGSERWSDEPCTDGCKVNAATFRAANTVTGRSAEFSTVVTDLGGAISRMEKIASIFLNANQGGLEVLFWGSAAGDEFFSIQNCYTPDSIINGYCAFTNEKYLGYVKSKQAYGDLKRRVYAISEAGKVTTPEIVTETYDFSYFVNYTYYQPGLNGWGDEKQMTGALGARYFTYQLPVYSGVVQTGVIGGIRTEREPCFNGCLENSYTVRATRKVAEANLTAWSEITTMNEVETGPVKTLVEAMQMSDQGYSVKLYAGVQKKGTEGDFYAIQDCFTRESVDIIDPLSSKWCIQAGAAVKYIAHLRVQKVFGNNIRYYKVWSNGTLGDMIGEEDTTLVVDKTSWYEKGADYGGWTNLEQYGTGALKSTYVLPKYTVSSENRLIPQGVIAADKVFPALQSTCSDVCVTNSYAFPLSYSLYHGALRKYKTLTTSSMEQELVKTLVTALQDFDYGYNLGINYLENCAVAEQCNYYGVVNCQASDDEFWKSVPVIRDYCISAGATASYVVIRRNLLIHSDTNYYFNAATVAGGILAPSLGNMTASSFVTHAMMQELQKRKFGHLGATSTTTNAPVFGTAGSFMVSIFDADYSTALGYIAIPMSNMAPCFNKCLRNSWATRGVRMAVSDQVDGGISPARFFGISDFSTMSLAIENLFNVMLTIDYGNNVMLFIGTEDGDFYGVKNCFIAPTLLADNYCKLAVRQGRQYIAYIRNTKYYGDNKRHIYGIQSSPTFALVGGENTYGRVDTQMGVTGSDYATTQRSWYKLRAGWTSLYRFSSGGLGQTYAAPFYNLAKNRMFGVIAGDKYGEESCFESCTRFSYAGKAVRALVQNGGLDRFAATDSQQTMSQAVSALYSSYDLNNQGTNKMLYFAMMNGDYYGVKNCRAASTDLDKFCADPVATARLLAHINNEAAYNDNKTRVFQISDSGVVNLPATVGMTSQGYDPLKEPWYVGAKAGNGWTYQATYGEFPDPITYSYKITNASDTNPKTKNNLIGVAGADRFVHEPCASACLYSSYAMSSTLDFITKNPDALKTGSAATNVKTIAPLIKMMWQSFKASDHGDNVQLMYTVDATGDFYAIKNCWLPGNYNDEFCMKATNKTWTVAMIRNKVAFGNSDINVFAIDSMGATLAGTMAETPLGTINATSLTAQRLNFPISDLNDIRTADFYKQQSGWGKVYGLRDGTVGQIFSVPVTIPTSDGTETRIGVVSAIRSDNEECFSGDDQDVPSIRVRVRTLDTVETIAKRYGYTWTELLLMNPSLTNPNELQSVNGRYPFLYNALLYVVREDDTLYSIATKYGISWQELADMNPQIPQIKAGLNWREMPSGDPGGFPYYYNLQTKKAQWDKPAEVIEAEKTDLKIFRGQKLAVRPNLEALVCQNRYYSAKATASLGKGGRG